MIPQGLLKTKAFVGQISKLCILTALNSRGTGYRVKGCRKSITGFFWDTIWTGVFLGTLITLFVSLANPENTYFQAFIFFGSRVLLVNIVNWWSISKAKWIITHLKTPTSIGPILGDIAQWSVIKANEFFHMLVSSEDVWLNSLLETWIGKDRAPSTKKPTRKGALIFHRDFWRRLPPG